MGLLEVAPLAVHPQGDILTLLDLLAGQLVMALRPPQVHAISDLSDICLTRLAALDGGGGAPSHRPFTPATVVPSVYLGQRRDGPTSTVGPWDSATQVPTPVSTRRYEPGHGREYGRRSRSRDPNTQVIQVVSDGFSCLHGSIEFQLAETVDQFLELWNRFTATMDDDMRNLRAATRALEEFRDPPEMPIALLNDWIAAQHLCMRSAFARYCFYFLHADLIDLDDERLQTRR
ncbi:hypothetical protein HG531_012218 [Fusarium graminearum]|nr:hypothetical protein HG531_012218 [Fusarium graminearum]